MMDESRIKELVDELDREVPKDGAIISFQQYGGGPDESRIVGSRVGLLRAGVELLRAGVGTAGEGKEEGGLTALRAITHAESDFQFDYFEEMSLPGDRLRETKNSHIPALVGVGLMGIVLLTIGFAVYGVARLFY
ncbi:MAG: hypothetical protein R3F03_14760 [Opitutaceae bacterium]